MTKHLPTIKEIAQAIGVSISTVSNALQGDERIGLRTRMRVQEMAKNLQYVPNQAAKHLRQHRSKTIGVLLPQLREEFFSLAIAGIEDALEGTGYQVFIAQSRDKNPREVGVVRSFLNSRVDGVIASISAETVDHQHFLELQDFGIPVVFFDRVPKGIAAHRVRCTVEAGACAVTNHLLGKGLRRIALLNGPETLEISQERLRGFRRAIAGAGIPYTVDFEKFTNLSEGDIAQKMAELCATETGVEAIIAFNDYVALHAMRWCKQHDRLPNRDIYFASFANLPITNFMDNPPLVSVEQQAYKMGEQAAKMLLDLLQCPGDGPVEYREVMLETELVFH